MRRNGSRALLVLPLLVVAVLMLALTVAGCGGSNEPAADAKPVEEAIFQGGIAQNIDCEPVGDFAVRGSEQPVFGCSYEEEKSMSGAMRAVDRCYVLEHGKLVDVTNELPAGTHCTISSP
jgi:hypothetical protein